MPKHKTKNVAVGLFMCLYPYVQVADFIKWTGSFGFAHMNTGSTV